MRKFGFRCQVCTACGRCFGMAGGAEPQFTVITESSLGGARDTCVKLHRHQISAEKRLITIDIGTTTVAMQLYKESFECVKRYVAANPQRRYGTDVISRIERATENEETLQELRTLIRQELARGMQTFIPVMEENTIPFFVIACNTTMSYLLLGKSPMELGRAPFFVSMKEMVLLEDNQLADITSIEGACGVVLPPISAFVGGDIVSGLLWEGFFGSREYDLFIDLGTNGEIVLGNCDKKAATATACGSAFEGGINTGVWGSQIIGAVAGGLQREVIQKDGALIEPYFKSGIRIGNIELIQEQIRSVQYAKAAIAAGIEILCNYLSINPSQIKQVVLAGGFGQFLNPKDALEIGLLPRELEGSSMLAGGNTALLGAYILGRHLLTAECEDTLRWEDFILQEANSYLQSRLQGIETINLAQVDGFQELYIKHLDFPQ